MKNQKLPQAPWWSTGPGPKIKFLEMLKHDMLPKEPVAEVPAEIEIDLSDNRDRVNLEQVEHSK